MSKYNLSKQLSPSGRKRRSEMLNELQKEVAYARQNRNQRVILSVLASSLLVCIVATAANGWWRQIEPSVTDQSQRSVIASQQPTGNQSTRGLSSRNRVSLELISDEQLLNALEEMGQPSTIAIIANEEVVVSQVQRSRK